MEYTYGQKLIIVSYAGVAILFFAYWVYYKIIKVLYRRIMRSIYNKAKLCTICNKNPRYIHGNKMLDTCAECARLMIMKTFLEGLDSKEN